MPLRSAYVPHVENFGVIFWTFGVFLIKPQGEEQRAGPGAEQEQKEQEQPQQQQQQQRQTSKAFKVLRSATFRRYVLLRSACAHSVRKISCRAAPRTSVPHLGGT